MAHRGVCPDMACQRVAVELERQASERRACQVVADELGIPVKTVLTWIHRNKVTSNEVSKGQANYTEKETSSIINLHTMQSDSGRKKIVFDLHETNGNQLLVIQEYRIGPKDKETRTKNRFTIPADLISEMRSSLEQVEVMIQEKDPGESGADAGDAKENGHEDRGAEAEPPSSSPDGAENTVVEPKVIRCNDCRRYTSGLQLKDREMKGSCQSQTLSWDGELFQVPDKPHSCSNFRKGN
jgi:hypothetical protein